MAVGAKNMNYAFSQLQVTRKAKLYYSIHTKKYHAPVSRNNLRKAFREPLQNPSHQSQFVQRQTRVKKVTKAFVAKYCTVE